MMLIKHQAFKRLYDDPAGSVFSDLILEECVFDNCYLSKRNELAKRTIVRNTAAERCRFVANEIGPAKFIDCQIINSTSGDLSIFWGSVFQRVKFAGKLTSIKISTSVTGLPEKHIQALYDADREEFYRSIDWAIDLSEVRLSSFDCKGVPAHLFRLDIETQGAVILENLPTEWKKIIPERNVWIPWLHHNLSSAAPEIVLVTPLARPKNIRDKFLEDLRELRRMGIVK